MSDGALLTVQFLVPALQVGALLVVVVAVSRMRAAAPADVDLLVRRRLAELLPVPDAGDRVALLGMLGDLAPGQPLALYALGDPTFLVTRRDSREPPGAEQARFIEVHRHQLALGNTLYDERCGALIPALDRFGRLRGAVIVGSRAPLKPDDEAQATLRHVAAILGSAYERDTNHSDAAGRPSPVPYDTRGRSWAARPTR